MDSQQVESPLPPITLMLGMQLVATQWHRTVAMETFVTLILSIVMIATAIIGGMLTFVGMTATPSIMSMVSIVTGLIMIGMSCWAFPYQQLMLWWDQRINKMTEEGKSHPLVNLDTPTKKETTVKMYTQTEVDNIIKHWVDEVSKVADKAILRQMLLNRATDAAEAANARAHNAFTEAEAWRGKFMQCKELLLISEKNLKQFKDDNMALLSKTTLMTMLVEILEMRRVCTSQERMKELDVLYKKLVDMDNNEVWATDNHFIFLAKVQSVRTQLDRLSEQN